MRYNNIALYGAQKLYVELALYDAQVLSIESIALCKRHSKAVHRAKVYSAHRAQLYTKDSLFIEHGFIAFGRVDGLARAKRWSAGRVRGEWVVRLGGRVGGRAGGRVGSRVDCPTGDRVYGPAGTEWT